MRSLFFDYSLWMRDLMCTYFFCVNIYFTDECGHLEQFTFCLFILICLIHNREFNLHFWRFFFSVLSTLLLSIWSAKKFFGSECSSEENCFELSQMRDNLRFETKFIEIAIIQLLIKILVNSLVIAKISYQKRGIDLHQRRNRCQELLIYDASNFNYRK